MDKLAEYIKSNLKKGHEAEDIANILIKHGHGKEDVVKAVSELRKELRRERVLFNYVNIVLGLAFLGVIFLAILFLLSFAGDDTDVNIDGDLSFYVKYGAILRNFGSISYFHNTLYVYPNSSTVEFLDDRGMINRLVVGEKEEFCIDDGCREITDEDRINVDKNILNIYDYYGRAVSDYSMNKSVYVEVDEAIRGEDVKCLVSKERGIRFCVDKENLPVYVRFVNGEWSIEFNVVENGVLK